MNTPLNDYSHDLHVLTSMLASKRAPDLILAQALEALSHLIDYDLAAVYELHGDELRVVAAAGPLASEQVRAHRLALSKFPNIRRVLEVRRPVAFEDSDHADHGDPYDGVLDLPHGHSCMVIPLRADEADMGIITIDRLRCETYDARAVRLADVYGQLVSLALWFANREAILRRNNQQLSEHNRLLLEESGATWACRRLEAGASAQMHELVAQAKKVAVSNAPVLVLGETGTGKELLAQAIHEWSARASGPFIKLNCAAIPENLVESELFGHVRGAFSGAESARRGRFVTANRGTLLLDEIGELPLPAQAKLLRVLQEGVLEPVGSDDSYRVDVRIVAATNVDLVAAVDAGWFRRDLYYRLATFPLQVPPLRERRADIAPIARDVLRELHASTGRGPWTLSAPAVEALERNGWPGNVRELRNVLERATIIVQAGEIGAAKLRLEVAPPSRELAASCAELPDFSANERAYLARLLERSGGKLYGEGGAAELSGLKPSTLRSKLVKHGLR
ncbi:sigma 54-interacting transcriptional regulator [Haliangium ochraceum]|uniref:Sigma 54 interacting domain protein n=1 Tax=Haliangium ochraceum (strain DSM 14365 / JCM 11303 / SMP-2) TaxID=502025 RepID=D0LMB6_HALO1|nr:sigma 54-interacting transcriptional regulator [Haliangium ochraceum]ACY16822.1 Sigma 54 interacting domain protein [Haliangium ochraceum DSM 14365]